MRSIALILFLLASLFARPAAAQDAPRWGVFEEMARRQWVTEQEPRPRATRFEWEVPGRVLIARHGFLSRLAWGVNRFADTVQRLELNSRTGEIESTYTYEDGRPPLRSTIRIQADGSAVETFTLNGVETRNIYRSPSLSVNLIERERMQAGQWARLGTTRKAGLTAEEIAENERRAEEARQLAAAQERARQAEIQAQIAAQQSYAAAEEQPSAPMGSVFLRELQGMAAQAQADAQRSTQQTNRLIANVQAQEAARRAREAREAADRMAAENARRNSQAEARRQAMASAAPDPRNQIDARPVGGASAPGGSTAGSSTSEAGQTFYMYCWAKLGARATHVSQTGSRVLSANQAYDWRPQMEAEFRRQIREAIDDVSCPYGTDSNVAPGVRASITRDNPTTVQWRPH